MKILFCEGQYSFIVLSKFVYKQFENGTIIKAPVKKKTKGQLYKEVKSFAAEGRDPKKAVDELYGIWEGRDISIEKIREKSTRKKW